MGRDRTLAAVPAGIIEFQFTRPRGARREGRSHVPALAEFQFTRPRGARRMAIGAIGAYQEFQFTRPRGARRETLHVEVRGDNVSIHAPAWGATSGGVSCATHRQFQFTRPRGARLDQLFVRRVIVAFQFTRPRGARPRARAERAPPRGVSIHAPAWGATSLPVALGDFPPCFNSRARVGRDSPSRLESIGKRAFQFTRPRGARPTPTPPHAMSEPVSIHAPAWGATLLCDGVFQFLDPFQFTRPRGARPA